MNKNLIVFFLIIIIGFGVWFFLAQNETTSESVTENWEVYNDSAGAFEIKYPPGWNIYFQDFLSGKVIQFKNYSSTPRMIDGIATTDLDSHIPTVINGVAIDVPCTLEFHITTNLVTSVIEDGEYGYSGGTPEGRKACDSVGDFAIKTLKFK